MDTKRNPSGQVVQTGLEPDGIDTNPTQSSGDNSKVGMQMVEGKTGSVQKMDMVQSSAHDNEGTAKPANESSDVAVMSGSDEGE